MTICDFPDDSCQYQKTVHLLIILMLEKDTDDCPKNKFSVWVLNVTIQCQKFFLRHMFSWDDVLLTHAAAILDSELGVTGPKLLT